MKRRKQKAPRQFALLGAILGLILASSLTSCTSTSAANSPGGKGAKMPPSSKMNSGAVQKRNQMIATEPRGDHYIGRRWFTDGTRYWGYLRKPGQTWMQSRLVVMNEWQKHQPDRLPEVPGFGERGHGFDHNSEYKLWGSYTGQTVYDPNSNLVLPEFRLSRYELINPNPGFLFYPGEPYNRRGLPPKHPATP